MPAPPKVREVEDALVILRDQVDKYTLWLERGFVTAGRPLRPMQRKEIEAKRTGLATGIELLTVNGSFYAEISESLDRVRAGGPRPEARQ